MVEGLGKNLCAWGSVLWLGERASRLIRRRGEAGAKEGRLCVAPASYDWLPSSMAYYLSHILPSYYVLPSFSQ